MNVFLHSLVLAQFSWADPRTWLSAMWQSVREGVLQVWYAIAEYFKSTFADRLQSWITQYLGVPAEFQQNISSLWTGIQWVELLFPAKLCLTLLGTWMTTYLLILMYRFVKSWIPTVG